LEELNINAEAITSHHSKRRAKKKELVHAPFAAYGQHLNRVSWRNSVGILTFVSGGENMTAGRHTGWYY
jgi:hypothetical protein